MVIEMFIYLIWILFMLGMVGIIFQVIQKLDNKREKIRVEIINYRYRKE